jgi:hypothetical protein
MKRISIKYEDFILSASIIIENSLSSEDVLNAVASYGYDSARIHAGKELHDDVIILSNRQKADYGLQMEATKALKSSWDAADGAYMKTLKIARIAFAGNIGVKTALMTAGKRKQSRTGWLEQAEAFYANLLSDENLLSAIFNYGYTQAKLEGEYALVKNVREKEIFQKNAAGNARKSTALRDEKIRALDKWLSEYRAVAKIALSDSPQKLEKLGIITRR